MNTALSTFMKIGVSVIVIAALLFAVGYKLMDNEASYYGDQVISHTNHPLTTSAATDR